MSRFEVVSFAICANLGFTFSSNVPARGNPFKNGASLAGL